MFQAADRSKYKREVKVPASFNCVCATSMAERNTPLEKQSILLLGLRLIGKEPLPLQSYDTCCEVQLSRNWMWNYMCTHGLPCAYTLSAHRKLRRSRSPGNRHSAKNIIQMPMNLQLGVQPVVAPHSLGHKNASAMDVIKRTQQTTAPMLCNSKNGA